jgi:MHS family alpha-ketoglutarate permease-like MFS transporter
VDAVAEWAWRIPFAVGAVLAIVALVLRIAMIESDVLRTAQAEGEVGPDAETAASADDRREAVRSGVKVFFFVALISIAFYTWLTSASSLATAQHGMDPTAAFASSLVAQLVCVAVMPFAGILSDRIGRRPIALTFTIGFAVLTAPLTLLISDQAWTLLVAQTIALVLVAGGNGIYSALLSEQFRTRHRARGIGIANSLSVAIFGGTALYVNLWLSSIGASWLYIVYVSLVAVGASIAVWRMRETRGIDLRA